MVTQKYIGDNVKITANLTNICPTPSEYVIQYSLQHPDGFYEGFPTFNRTLSANETAILEFNFNTTNYPLGIYKFRILADDTKTNQRFGIGSDIYAFMDAFELIAQPVPVPPLPPPPPPPVPTPAYTLDSYFRTLTSPSSISSASVGNRIRYSAIAKKDGVALYNAKVRFYTLRYPFTGSYVWYLTTDTRSDGWVDGDYTITQDDANAGPQLRFLSILVDRTTGVELTTCTADLRIV